MGLLLHASTALEEDRDLAVSKTDINPALLALTFEEGARKNETSKI